MMKEFAMALQKGEQLENASKVANRTHHSTILVALLIALAEAAKMFGFSVPLGNAELTDLATALSTLWMIGSSLLHVASNPNAGG